MNNLMRLAVLGMDPDMRAMLVALDKNKKIPLGPNRGRHLDYLADEALVEIHNPEDAASNVTLTTAGARLAAVAGELAK